MSPISSRKRTPRWASSSSPSFSCTAPVKAPRTWPKSSLSRSSRLSPAQLRSTNASSRRCPWRVEPARQHALAAAGLAEDEDRAVGAERLHRRLAQAADGGAGAEERIDVVARAPLAGRGLLAAQAAVLQRALEDLLQRRQLDRLGEELLGALLDRLHRQVDRAVRGEHQDHHVRIELAQAVDGVHRLAVRQHVVEDHRVRPRLHQQRARLLEALRLLDVETPPLEKVSDGEANGRIVVDDEDLAAQHGVSSTHHIANEPGRRWRRPRCRIGVWSILQSSSCSNFCMLVVIKSIGQEADPSVATKQGLGGPMPESSTAVLFVGSRGRSRSELAALDQPLRGPLPGRRGAFRSGARGP